MKKLLLQLVLLASLLAWGATGCSNKEIDTAKLQSTFQDVTPEVRPYLDQGIAAIKAGKFAEALPALQHVAYATKMNPEQRLVLEDAIKKVKVKAKAK
jgi:hypothetical protein